MKTIRYYTYAPPGTDPARGPFKPWEKDGKKAPKKRGKRG